MCTALTLSSKDGFNFFGRNMDLEYNFNQSILVVPRNYEYIDRVTKNSIKTKYALIGMGSIIDNYPAMADGMNEMGLACAGLNFAGYAHYEENLAPNKTNIAPYDFILWVLINHETINDVIAALQNLEIVNVPINPQYPVPTLHWIITDKSGKSIVVEKTKEKFSFYENKVGVLTNNPTFDWHLTNLNEYITLSANHTKETTWSDLTLKPLGVGIGTHGIPGDFASVSRFVRISFIRSRKPVIDTEENALSEFFNMLSYVAMVKGGAMTAEDREDLTLYTACMNQQKGIYYYKTYKNNRINAVDMHKEDLDCDNIKVYPYLDTQDVNHQN